MGGEREGRRIGTGEGAGAWEGVERKRRWGREGRWEERGAGGWEGGEEWGGWKAGKRDWGIGQALGREKEWEGRRGAWGGERRKLGELLVRMDKGRTDEQWVRPCGSAYSVAGEVVALRCRMWKFWAGVVLIKVVGG